MPIQFISAQRNISKYRLRRLNVEHFQVDAEMVSW